MLNIKYLIYGYVHVQAKYMRKTMILSVYLKDFQQYILISHTLLYNYYVLNPISKIKMCWWKFFCVETMSLELRA